MKTLLVLFNLLIANAFVPKASAQPLTALDSTFSSDGILVQDSLQRISIGKLHLAIQTDGKLLTAGTYGFWGTSQFQMGAILTRFHPDGRRDSSFGQAGVLQLLGNTNENTIGLHVLPDGRIITATATDVYQGNSYTLHRLLSNGAHDPSFNDSGKVVYKPNVSPGNTYYRHLAVQPDGKVLLTGEWWQGALFNFLNVFRHEANGRPDSSYGLYGRSSNILFNTYKIVGHTMTHQPDGKLLVAGSAQDTPVWLNRNKAVIARCLPDGSLDTSFNDGLGYFKHATPGERGSCATSVLVQPNGKILMATFSQRRYEGPLVCSVIQLRADGQLDSLFGIAGKVEVDSIIEHLAYNAPPTLALQADGRILIAYTEGMDTATQRFAVRRLLVSGSTDNSFGSDGKVSTRVSSLPGQASAIAVQPDGRIVAAGVNVHPSTSYTSLGMVRYHPYITLPSTTVAASPISTEPALHIFPNPAHDAVHVSCVFDAAGAVQASLYDAAGRIAQQWSLGTQKGGRMDVSLRFAPALPPGQYLLRLESGGQAMSEALIKR